MGQGRHCRTLDTLERFVPFTVMCRQMGGGREEQERAGNSKTNMDLSQLSSIWVDTLKGQIPRNRGERTAGTG